MTLVLNTIDIAALKRAFTHLDAAITQAKSELERGGAQCFEYSFELAWKTLRRTLRALGKDIFNNPRFVFREAASNNLIEDAEQRFRFVDYRNKTVHTYNEQITLEIFAMFPLFRHHLKDMIQRLETLQP